MDLARSTASQSSPSSVIEELQGRFQNSNRAREKKPILKNTDHTTPVYHHRTATSITATATLASRPHHQSDLTLPTTTSSSFEQPVRSINTATTVRVDPNGTLRANENSAFCGGIWLYFFNFTTSTTKMYDSIFQFTNHQCKIRFLLNNYRFQCVGFTLCETTLTGRIKRLHLSA